MPNDGAAESKAAIIAAIIGNIAIALTKFVAAAFHRQLSHDL
jgi:hypothetical protein